MAHGFQPGKCRSSTFRARFQRATETSSISVLLSTAQSGLPTLGMLSSPGSNPEAGDLTRVAATHGARHFDVRCPPPCRTVSAALTHGARRPAHSARHPDARCPPSRRTVSAAPTYGVLRPAHSVRRPDVRCPPPQRSVPAARRIVPVGTPLAIACTAEGADGQAGGIDDHPQRRDEAPRRRQLIGARTALDAETARRVR